MVSGRDKNQDRADKAQKDAVKALQPKAYSDPYGSLNNGKFTPTSNSDVQGAMGSFEQSLQGLSGQLNKPFDVNDYYNNPFYGTVSEQYKAPVLRQYAQDSTDLDNSLNARNQLGSSYDALMKRNLMQQRDFQLNQADDQARNASANAYQQQYNNLIQSLNAALSGRGQLLDQIYAPAKLALGYQGAVAPLQSAAAGVYNTAQQQYLARPTSTDRFFQYLQATSDAAKTVGKAVGGGV